MSGIYIKGMEMPKSCERCLFQNPYMGGWCFLLNGNSNTYSRRRDCPLIPVPPHGRLIDADALTNECMKEDSFLAEMLFQKVNNAPTIIPAEPPKEET